MSNPLPSMTPGQPAAVPAEQTSSVLDRISSWVSENKAVVYTIAGIAIVVTGAGAVYYLNADSVRTKWRLVHAFLCIARRALSATFHRLAEPKLTQYIL